MNEGKDLQLVTFESTTAKEILAKLHREIERLLENPKAEFAVDHVINAFWTAWHMHVWVWDAIKDQPALKEAVIKYRGLEEEIIRDASSFGVALARRFVPLKICRKIATDPRHVQINCAIENGDPAHRSQNGGESSGGVGDGGEESAPAQGADSACTAVVTVMGRPVSVIQLLREVEDYWITLIHENGVEQLR